jgi:hypothetical protein
MEGADSMNKLMFHKMLVENLCQSRINVHDLSGFLHGETSYRREGVFLIG